MSNTTKLIKLSAEEIIELIKEKSVFKDGICISSHSSFLRILALLDDEMAQRMPYARSNPA